MPDQPSLAETLCEALALVRDALAEVPCAVTEDGKRGTELLQSSGRLGPLLHTLANQDMPLANALSDVQAALADIGEHLLYAGADAGAEEESVRLTEEQFLTPLSTLLARVAADLDVEARMRRRGRGVLRSVRVNLIRTDDEEAADA